MATEPMTREGLARLVARMRRAQAAYFKGRRAGDLADALALERDVDRAVAAILEGPTLFDAAEDREATTR